MHLSRALIVIVVAGTFQQHHITTTNTSGVVAYIYLYLSGSAGAATVALRDLTGRLVLAPTALPADGQLPLPATLAAGVYLLEVQQAGTTAVRRIEKK